MRCFLKLRGNILTSTPPARLDGANSCSKFATADRRICDARETLFLLEGAGKAKKANKVPESA